MVTQRWVDPSAPEQRAPASSKWQGFAVRLDGKRVNDWQIEEYLDEGAYSLVYRARHRETGELAALKIMKPDLVTPRRAERFRREAVALSRVDHPNIVKLIEADRAEVVGEPFFYIALELLKGMTLEQAVFQRGKLPEQEVFWMAGEIIAALIETEGRKMVHGDLKPSNIFLTEDERVMVMDFGHSTMLEFDALTKSGSFIGTAAFAAPEQFIDSSKIDTLTDQYSLGCVCYFALTGNSPFPDARTLIDLMEAHTKAQPTAIRKVHPQLSYFAQEFVNRLMRKNPRQRFPSMKHTQMVLRARERSNFFYSLLPEQTVRRSSAAFWASAVFPEFLAPRCPLDRPVLELTSIVQARVSRLPRGQGHTVIIEGPRGSGVSRALLEALQNENAVQVSRARLVHAHKQFEPLQRLFEGLFPNHAHEDFHWEEQFRWITDTPPDQWTTLRTFLNSPREYVENFGEDRDARLAQETAFVLTKLAEDLPIVCIWDHCETFSQRFLALLLKLLPKLEAAPILSCVVGAMEGPEELGITAHEGYEAWGGLVRSLERQCKNLYRHVQPPLETAQMQKLLAHYVREEGDMKFLLRKSKGYHFDSYQTFFTWMAYWVETLYNQRVSVRRKELLPQDYAAIDRDPLIDGSLAALFGARWRRLSPTEQRALSLMASEGVTFDFPRAEQFDEPVSRAGIFELLHELEHRWHIALFADYGEFRHPAMAPWIRRRTVRRPGGGISAGLSHRL